MPYKRKAIVLILQFPSKQIKSHHLTGLSPHEHNMVLEGFPIRKHTDYGIFMQMHKLAPAHTQTCTHVY